MQESIVHYLSNWCDKVVCIYDYQCTRLSMDTSPSWSHLQMCMIACELNSITPNIDVVPRLSSCPSRGPSSFVGFLAAAKVAERLSQSGLVRSGTSAPPILFHIPLLTLRLTLPRDSSHIFVLVGNSVIKLSYVSTVLRGHRVGSYASKQILMGLRFVPAREARCVRSNRLQ